MITKLRVIAGLLLVASLNTAFGQAPVISSFSPSAGAVGTLVTVNGSNLNKAISFSIGRQNAIVISNHGTSAVVMVMPNATTGPVSANIADSVITAGSGFTVAPTNAQFGQQGPKLVADGSAENNQQGFSVALSADGSTAIVGAPFDTTYHSIGGAFIYTRNNGTWVQQGGKLVGTGSVGNTVNQGWAVAISADGNTAVIGGPGDNGTFPSSEGAAWIFVRNGTTWAQQGAKLAGTGGVGYPTQGTHVAISADGNTSVVTGPDDNQQGNSYQGAIWVYTRTGTTWTQQGNKLVASGNTAALGESLSLSADGNTAIVGGGGSNSAIGAGFIFYRSGNTWTQQAELVGSNNGSEEQQGYSVAISADGNTAIIGGPDDNNFIGAAWVFTRTSNVWAQQGSKLVGSGNVGMSIEGCSVSLSADGNTALIGGSNDNTNQGAVWVFSRNNGAWAQQGSKLVGSNIVGQAQFGLSVSVSADGNTAIVGGVIDNSYQGAAWVFAAPPPAISSFSPAVGAPGTLVTINGSGLGGVTNIIIGGKGAIIISNTSSQLVAMVMPGASTGAISLTTTIGTTTSVANFNAIATKYPTAQQGGKLVGTGASGASTQGFAVAISADGNTAIVGGSQDNSNQGAVWVYTRSAGAWAQQGAKLVSGGNVGAASFGASVALSADGNTMLAGGVGDNSEVGAAWVFTRSNGVWSQQGSKLVGSGSVGTSEEGSTVSLSADGNTAIIAGRTDNSQEGAIWVFTRSSGIWAQQGPKLVGSGSVGSPLQGTSVALSADGYTVAVGGLGDNSSNGAAWVFTRTGNSWSQQGAKLVGTGNIGLANQGAWVAISADGNTVMETGMSDNAGVGAAWIFTRSGNSWAQQSSKLVGTGSIGNSQQGSGAALSADGNTAVLGGPGDNSSQGAAWVFTRSNGTWTQQGSKLAGTGNSGVAYQAVAVSLSANGTTLISGGGEDNSFQGAAWIFSASSNATLSALTISKGLISPAFKSTTTSYTAVVANGVNSITLTPTLSDPAATVTVNGTAVTSGTSSGGVPLIVGSNNIPVVVTAQDGITTKTYTVTVTRVVPGNANLSALTISSGSLSPGFAPGTTSYTVSEANSVAYVYIRPTASGAGSTITVNGTVVASGAVSGQIPLALGANTISIVVTASDGVTIQTYTITATRALSSVATLSALSVSAGTLTPVFATGTTSYTVPESNGTTSVTIQPTTTSTVATVTVNGTAVTSGSSSAGIPLAVGPNIIQVVVTAQDGTTKQTYTIVANRAGSSIATLSALALSNGTLTPAFASGTTSYTAVVANGVSSVTLTPTTADPTATVTVNGAAVTSGTSSGSVPLVVGSNSIPVVVTAQDGVTIDTYTVTVTRVVPGNANLSALTISNGTLSPTFTSGNTTYSVSEANGVASVVVRPTASDAGATITVNGTAVTSGAISGQLPLAVGSNTISVAVTASDGVTIQTYTITATRAPSAVATLSNLTVSAGSLTPAFAAGTTAYTVSETTVTTSITIKPTTTSTVATVTVNGTAVTSGTSSGSIPLAVGPNNILVVVTAQDGTTMQTYTITATREAPGNANLSALTISNGTLSPAFASATTSYTVAEANGVASVLVRPTAGDAAATIKVNGTTVASGSLSGQIPLTVGSNTISVVVTASDGVTIKTYTITATRAPSAVATLSALTISAGALTPAFATGTTSYTVSETNSTTSITVKPTTTSVVATETVNGTAVTSGTSSSSIPLAVGPNNIQVVVTAQDGTTMETYTITTTRASGGADTFDPGINVTKPTETSIIADDGIAVHQGISPNGDGINDYLQIDNISQYPDNKLTIMNRNGQLVYEARGYDNSSKTFDGHSNKNGQLQLPGTYFYELEYKVGGVTRRKTGFIVLKY